MNYPNDFINKIICGDCLEVMKDIPDKSIDMILCDLPYGTTACKWDIIIPFKPLWKEYKRIIKDNGAIVLTASQPFTSMLVMSNLEWFKYEWIWEKSRPTRFLLANKLPLLSHENILIFYKNQPIYNPQKWQIDEKYIDRRKNHNTRLQEDGQMAGIFNPRNKDNGLRYPFSIISCNSEWNKKMHPTQKPVALFEYLIKTYTNEGDLVLDNCAGSGTTGVACKNLGRDFILIEKMKKYVGIARKRVNATPEPLFV